MQSVRSTPAKVADEGNQSSQLKRAKEEAVLASSVAARELRAVLGLASRRGLNAEDVFQHFRVEGEKNADADVGKRDLRRAGTKEIVGGMASLGVSLSEEAAALLIETIIRSRAGSVAEPSTQSSVATSSFRDSVGQPRCVVSNQTGPTPGVISRKPAATGNRGPSRQSAAQGLRDKSLSPLRQWVTAEDLWKFAHRELEHCAVAAGDTAMAAPNDRVQHTQAHGKHERLPSASQENAGVLHVPPLNRPACGDLGRSPKRRRIKSSGCIRGGDNATHMTGIKRPTSEKLRGTEGAYRGHRVRASTTMSDNKGEGGSVRELHRVKKDTMDDTQLQFGRLGASLPTMSCFSAIGDAGATAGAIAARSKTAWDGGHKARHTSIPIHVETGPQEANGTPESDRNPLRSRHGVSNVGTNRLPALAGSSFRAKESAEIASFPCNDPAFEAMHGKDRVFHVDR